MTWFSNYEQVADLLLSPFASGCPGSPNIRQLHTHCGRCGRIAVSQSADSQLSAREMADLVCRGFVHSIFSAVETVATGGTVDGEGGTTGGHLHHDTAMSRYQGRHLIGASET